MAEKLEPRDADIKTQRRHPTEVLRSKGFVAGANYAPRGYGYHFRGNAS